MNSKAGTSTLPPMCPHFLADGKLVLEMHARGAFLDHLQHEFVGVERPAETGFGVRHDRRPEVEPVFAAEQLNLVGALERLVDAAHDHGHAVRRVEALVGIHGGREIVVRGHLPAAQVDGLADRPGPSAPPGCR